MLFIKYVAIRYLLFLTPIPNIFKAILPIYFHCKVSLLKPNKFHSYWILHDGKKKHYLFFLTAPTAVISSNNSKNQHSNRQKKMFRNFRQTNFIRLSNLMYFKRQKFHMSYSNVCAATPSLKSLTGTILGNVFWLGCCGIHSIHVFFYHSFSDFTNFVKIIGTITDCEPIVDGFKYTISQVDNSSKKKM